MGQVNMLYALNLHNATGQIYLNFRKKEKKTNLLRANCLQVRPQAWLSNLSRHQNHLEDFFKRRSLGPNPRVAGSIGGKGSLRICISIKFLGDTEAAGLRNTL